ncbi:outer membrane beta-barrel family protein [Winogradskyella jejuensis]|uniref:Outer membrane receptor proteins, mostly Fe transport n=1 Tax=Winogradskyella jejuensis TaxID=1089305 RepID=A0A1M5SSQ5_9FLAO|nr:outer membrane beta-barrel family protein [Winogradskyella jejuensis]SHH41536.1 Outer membrane receptor proteins, mostly Fe transport [Winogradskyella jejuensis]
MKSFILLLLSLVFGVTWSQNTITGKIVTENKQSVQAAIISLLDVQTNGFIKGELSNEKGEFLFKSIENGSYYLLITSLGLKDYKSEPFDLENTNKTFEQIVMQDDSEALEEVTIVAERPMIQVQADKTVFNVANTVNAIGDNGFELLRKAPGIIIDNSDSIIVEGKAGVLFYIDDRPSVLRGQDLVNFLKTLQASDIDNIEIITQPSSRYDAEGNAGIINIKLKRDKSLGTNGSIASGLTVGDYARYNNSISFNNRNKRTSLYGTYSNNFGKSTGFINLNRTQNNINFDARSNSVFDNNSNNLRLGFDYYANDKSTFGIIATGNFNNSSSETDSRTPIRPVSQQNPDEVLISGSDSDNKTTNIFTNLNYRFKDTLGHSLNVDLDYGKYNSERFNLQPNRYFNGDETQVISENIVFFDTPIDISIVSGQADYKQNFLKGVLSAGFKYSKVYTENSFDAFDRTNGANDLDESQSNDFDYDEQIYAAYFNYNRKFEKLNIQIGLRMENTVSDGQLTSLQANQNNRVERNYTNWFPSGGITYQVNRKNTLSLNYSKRIQRPNYQSLNPFQYRIDELSFRQGNPFLQPQYTDNLKLSHTYNYRLTTSISYTFVSDFFAQITEAGPNNTNFIIQRNVANQKIINLGVSYPTKFNDWWNVYISLNAYRSIYEATNPDFVETQQNTLSLYAQNTFKISKGLTAEISGWFNSPSVWGGTYETESLGALNIAFQKRFLDDKLTARLAFNDILFTSPWRGTTQFGDLFIDGNGGNDSRQVRFNLTYNFGRDEIKKAQKRKTGIEDEKNRI